MGVGDLINKAKGLYASYKADVAGMTTENPMSLKKVRERQGPGFWQADIGETEAGTVGRDRTYRGNDGEDVSIIK